jgi:CHAD domain-containing protein
LRSDLRTFRRVVDATWNAALTDELRWIGGLLGAVRDTDVLLERLEGRLVALGTADSDAAVGLLDGLRAKRTIARDALLVAMRDERYLTLLDRLIDASRHVPGPIDASDLGVEITDLVHQPWKKLRAAADALDLDSPDPELHAVRILAKRCRYAAEAVAPAEGKPARKFAAAVAALQEVLGEHQDAVIAAQWLREHATDGSGTAASAFVAGELATLERAAADASRELWPDVWHAARAPELRKWL